MKPHERRAIGAYPYFVLATWDSILQCFRDGKSTYSSYIQAQAGAKKPGRYRIAKVNEKGKRKDYPPFDIA